MKLNLVLVLSALFAYSDCMNLSDASKISILDILHNHSGITDPENFLSDLKGLERTLSHVDKEGSTELAAIFVRAYKSDELNQKEIHDLIHETVRVGNTNAFIHLFKKIDFYEHDVAFKTALINGHFDIAERLYLKLLSWTGNIGDIAPEIIRAGQFKALRWLAEKGELRKSCLRESLVAALEADRQEMLDYLLNERTYIDISGNYGLLTYEEALRNGQCPRHDKVFIKAAEVGNMKVVEYFLERNLLTKRANFEEAQKAAAKNGHTDIADLMGTLIMVYDL